MIDLSKLDWKLHTEIDGLFEANVPVVGMDTIVLSLSKTPRSEEAVLDMRIGGDYVYTEYEDSTNSLKELYRQLTTGE